MCIYVVCIHILICTPKHSHFTVTQVILLHSQGFSQARHDHLIPLPQRLPSKIFLKAGHRTSSRQGEVKGYILHGEESWGRVTPGKRQAPLTRLFLFATDRTSL